MRDHGTMNPTLETLPAAGLETTLTFDGSTAKAIITDGETGPQFVVRDSGMWPVLVQAAVQAGFEFEDG